MFMIGTNLRRFNQKMEFFEVYNYAAILFLKLIYTCSSSFYRSSPNVSLTFKSSQTAFANWREESWISSSSQRHNHATPHQVQYKCRNPLIRPGKVPKIPVHQFTANLSFRDMDQVLLYCQQLTMHKPRNKHHLLPA